MNEQLSSRPELIQDEDLKKAKAKLRQFVVAVSMKCTPVDHEKFKAFMQLHKYFDKLSVLVSKSALCKDKSYSLKFGLPDNYKDDADGFLLNLNQKEAAELKSQLSPEEYIALCSEGLLNHLDVLTNIVNSCDEFSHAFKGELDEAYIQLGELTAYTGTESDKDKIPLYSEVVV